LYRSIFKLLHALTRQNALTPLLNKIPGVYSSVQELVSSVYELLQDCSDDEQEVSSDDQENTHDGPKLVISSPYELAAKERESTYSLVEETLVSRSAKPGYVEIPKEVNLQLLVKATVVAVNSAIERTNAISDGANKDDKNSDETCVEGSVLGAKLDPEIQFEEDVNRFYEATMHVEQFKNQTLYEQDGNLHHHYRTQIEEDINGKVSKTRARRLNRELKALKKSLPLHFSSSIFLRVDPKRPFVLQALVTGPVRTPYESGCFLFDIYIPTGFPNEPPKVNLMTTGNGTVRFNPNLYNNGKVCLSLLGTWRGGASGSEQWQKTSSIYQVLVSIQSLILGSEYPYFNEPGVEAQWGTEQGELQKRIHSNGGYERLRVATTQHAILGMLLSPPAGFEQVIEKHFLVKRHVILNTLQQWLHEAAASDSKGHFRALSKCAQELRKELAKLGPSYIDELVKVRDAKKTVDRMLAGEKATHGDKDKSCEASLDSTSKSIQLSIEKKDSEKRDN